MKHVKLVLDKRALKLDIYARLQIGLQFLEQKVNTKKELDEWWNSFIDWDIYNLELIKQAFDKPNNSYATDYKRNSGYAGLIIYGEDSNKPEFQEYVESSRDEMKWQVRRLKQFYEKIDLLKTSEEVNKPDSAKNKFNDLIELLTKFHKVAQELRDRRQNRETLIVRDEYDVQDLLNALLYLNFEDIRREEFSPSNSGSNSRIDFILKKEKIILEVKMSRSGFGTKKLGDELLIDIGRYKEYPDCSDLVIFIYDKGDFIRNKKGLINDLQKQSTDALTVTVIINPH